MPGEKKKTEGASRDMQEGPTPLLRVYTFGAFELVWHATPCTAETVWDSRTSARALFKLLLCAPGRQASKSLLAGILWPEVEEERARESLRSAYKVLRKVLRTAGGEELIAQRTTDEILHLAEQTRLWVDADAFEELVSQASRTVSPDATLALWEEANALLRGEFFADDQSAEWARHRLVKKRQQGLWLARCRMTRHLAELYVRRGQTSLAEETLEAHLLHFPTDQDALYRLLLLLEQQGCFEQASILYERTRRTLEVHGKQPAHHVRVLYERFQQVVSSSDRVFPDRTSMVSPAAARGEPSQISLASVVIPALSRGGSEDTVTNLISSIGRMSSFLGIDGLSDGTLDVLRVLLGPEREGMQDLSLLSRRQLLELGIAAFLSRLAQLDGKRISAIEREALSRALSESIVDGWKHLFSLENAQVVAIGRVQLALIHQAHTVVYPSALPYFYAGANSLIGIGLHFQERDEEALQAYHHGYIASLATGDPWCTVQSLICQADSYHALRQYSMAIQSIEEALRIIATSADEDGKMTRARAHLLSCWADNAMMLHDDRTTQEKLDMAETYLDPDASNEEFDRAAWLLIAGKYALNSRNSAAAKDCFEEALVTLPEQWLLRRAMTATGLAMACARMGERDSSLAIAKNLIPLITTTNAPMTNRWFAEYLQQDLLGMFPADSEIQGFVVDSCRQLPQGASLLRSGKRVHTFLEEQTDM